MKRTLLALALGALTACSGARSSPATRYQGMLLNARSLGVEQLRTEVAADPTVRDWVARNGAPDFIYRASETDLELIYTSPSRLAHFHRPEPDAPSVVSEVSPLPSSLLGILPRDLRAQTPTPEGGPEARCWRAPVGTGSCRTCCKTTTACATFCDPDARP
jgi:hypothetical protein